MRFLVLLVVSAVASIFAFGAVHSPADPEPSPDLSPAEVIQIQVDALQANDDPATNAGIEMAFRFASPSNKAATGPLGRFREMIRMGYGDLLGFELAEYSPIQVAGNEAAQVVTFTQADGQRSAYVFILSRQEGGEFDGCWMTDSVVPHPIPSAPERPVRTA